MSFLNHLRTFWRMRRAQRAIGHLACAHFHKVWRGDDLEAFYEFMRTQGLPARGFLISYPLDSDDLAWFFYRVLMVRKMPGKSRVVAEMPEIALPDERSRNRRFCPKEWRGYPVWRYTY